MKPNLRAEPSQYQVVKTLFEGKNCSVYKVLREESGADWQHFYVLKILNSKSQLSDCIDEFESLTRMHSRRCVRVYNWEWINGRPALLLEFIDGETLFSLCQRFELSSEIKNYILDEVYSGLLDLKEQNLVHGDLSPKNIMLSAEGEVKLIDYGMGNFFGDETKFTIGFVAPEVVAGERQTHQSDLFSLGCVVDFLKAPGLNAQELLKLEPQERQYTRSKISKNAQQKLSALMRKHPRFELETMSLSLMQPKRLSFYKKSLAAAIFPFLLVGASSTSPAKAHLSVKTDFWVKLRLRDQEIFAPVEDLALSAGEYVISWQTSKKSGTLRLLLKPGQQVLLKAKDF